IAAGDDHARGQMHGVVQALGRGHSLTVQDDLVANWLHAKDAHFLRESDRDNLLLETLVMSVHNIERHLDGVEAETMRIGNLEHLEVDLWILVSSKTDVAD